jgi:sugar lactone lactonase YvrE
VRRLLTACAVAMLGFASFVLVLKGPAAFAAAKGGAGQTAAAASTSTSAGVSAAAGTAAPAKAIVVAEGILARALAHDPHTSLYLTTAAPADRVFTIATPSTTSTANTDAVTAAGKLDAFAGTGQIGSLGDAGTALLAQFGLKTDSMTMRSGVAVAADGTVFIADTFNATIRRVAGPNSSEPGVVASIAGRWAASQGVTLEEPMGIALDRAGNLYIADHTAGAVYVMSAATSAAPGTLEIFAHVVSPASVAVTLDGSRVFVASPDKDSAFAIDTKTRAINAVTGFDAGMDNGAALIGKPVTDPLYCPPGWGVAAGITMAPQMPCPAGLAVDGGGNLFIADANSGQIRRIDAKTGANRLAASGLNTPGDISFDADGNLFVAEQGRDRIMEFKGMGIPSSVLTLTAPAALPPPTAPQICTPLTVQPDAYSFCNEAVTGVVGPEIFTLTNTSASTVNGLTWAVSPSSTPSNFTISGSSCTTSLAAGASCTVSVEFTPQQSGEDDAALTASDTAGDSASTEVGGTGTDYQIALAATQTAQLNVEQGAGVTFNLQVIPDAIFSDTVTFVCPPAATAKVTSNGFVPPYTSCTFSPASAVVSGGAPVPFTVTFQTTYNFVPPIVTTQLPPVGGAPSGPSQPIPFPGVSGIVAICAIFGLFWIAFAKRLPRGSGVISARLRRAIPAVSLAIVVVGIGLLGACHKSYTNPATETTPTGLDTMSITGTSEGVSRGIPITLDVVEHQPILPARASETAH